MGAKEVDAIVEKHESSGRFFYVEGHKTFALDHGKGEPVVCIHGVPTSSFLYRKLIKELKELGYRGICIDLPGLGLTDRPTNFDYSFSSLSKYLQKAIDVLELKKFHLVVHDIGGPIGFHLAAGSPERISSLTILNTWIDVVNYTKPFVMQPLEKKVFGEAEVAAINHLTWPLMFKKIGVERNDTVSKDEINVYVNLLKRKDQGRAFLKIMRSFDYSEKFRDRCYKAVQDTPYPIQAIWGENDPALTFQRYGLEVKELARLPKITKLPARHLLQEEVWFSIAKKIDDQIKNN